MLEQLHVLLTYSCNFECDHCFVYSGPEAPGTMTVGQLRELLDQAVAVGTVEWVYFEGGEAFLLYPLLVEGVREARARGFRAGIVTNSYWATSIEDALLWLRPLAELGLEDLSVSDDAFHHGDDPDTPAKTAMQAAAELGIPGGAICVEPPLASGPGQGRGEAIAGGGVMFRGRAVEKLIDGLPRQRWESFTECPYEELVTPSRIHVDPYGHVQLCQGISIGNVWETPLAGIVAGYDHSAHPICGPLVRGGPAALATELDGRDADEYVDACHLCYTTRRARIDGFPAELAPRQVYGLA